MLGKIKFENYEKCYPKRLRRFFRKSINYKTYDDFIPQMESAKVGNIPAEIINLFKTEKKEKIRIFQEALSEVARYIRENRKFIENEKLNEPKRFDERKVKIFENYISNLFNEKIKSVMPDNEYAELKFAGSGGYALLFKMSVFDNKSQKIMHDKAFKVFYSLTNQLPFNSPYHNNYAEANIWTFLKFAAGHKLDKTQFTKHYISDMKSGYYMTEFIDKDIPKTTERINYINILKINYNDFSHNKPIQDKIYDAGGFVKLKNFIDDKVVRRYYKKIRNRNTKQEQEQVAENLKAIVQNPKTPHRDKIIKALEIYEKEKRLLNHTPNKQSWFNFIKSLFGF